MEDLLSNARQKVVGTKQTIKALEKGSVCHVFLARDAEERVIQPILALCEEKNIEPYYVDTMSELGKLCKIKVKAAAAAITEQ